MWGPSRFGLGLGVGVMHPIFASRHRSCWRVLMFFWLGGYILVEGLEYVGILSVPRGSRSGVYAPDFCFSKLAQLDGFYVLFVGCIHSTEGVGVFGDLLGSITLSSHLQLR